MRVLLDESLPRQLIRHLEGQEVATVLSQGWSSTRNGELLRLAARRGFTVFLTADQGIEFQQNLSDLTIGVVIVKARSNRLVHLLPLVPDMLAAIKRVARGTLIRVGA